MVRGIQNTSGVSCHISCALQILSHSVPLLRETLEETAKLLIPVVQASTNGEIDADPTNHQFVCAISAVFQDLADDSETALDPTQLYQCLQESTTLDPGDVGDVSTAIHQLLRILRQQNEEWDAVIQSLLSGGQTRQIIQGTKIIQNEIKESGIPSYQKQIRTKKGKPKRMACPFPLAGSFDSISNGLHCVTAPINIEGYSWETQAEDCYHEEMTELSQDSEPSSTLAPTDWKTTKQIQLERLPPHLLLSLERFAYNLDGDRLLKNSKISVPLQLDPSICTRPAGESMSKPPLLELTGGVIHIIEDSIDEEGHYVTLIRQGSCTESPSKWALIDDENYRFIPQELALTLLNGGEDENGGFCCATMVAYSTRKEDILESSFAVAKEKLVDRYVELKRNLPEPIDWSKPFELVGRRLKVRWSKGKFYSGVIASYDSETGKHRVKYDDGDERDYNLSKKVLRWLP